jgi:hypothetical protein
LKDLKTLRKLLDVITGNIVGKQIVKSLTRESKVARQHVVQQVF